MRKLYIYAAMLIAGALSLSAQSRGFLSREALDSLVNPKNSTKALGVLTLSHSTIALGEIEGDDTVYFNFELRNIDFLRVFINYVLEHIRWYMSLMMQGFNEFQSRK